MKRKKSKTATKRQKTMHDFFKSSNYEADVHVYYTAHCKKCVADTLATRQTVNCGVCYLPLQYHCAMCDKPFLNLKTIKNHVIEELEELPKLTKCSKCYRSQFSTRCSFLKHERDCDATFFLDKEIFIQLERCDIQLDLFKDEKVFKPLSLIPNELCNLEITKTENIFQGFYDQVEIENEFKTSCIIDQRAHDGTLQHNDTEVKKVRECNQNGNQRQKLDCSPKFATEVSLAGPLNSKHLLSNSNSYKCRKCGKKYLIKKCLVKHTSTCGRIFSCDHCQYKTKVKSLIERHVREVHGPKDLNLNKCHKCAKVFIRKENLKLHLKVCGKSQDFKCFKKYFHCNDCNYKSQVKGNLVRHILVKHLPRDFNSNNCNKCGKNFSHKSHLKAHSKNCPKDSSSFLQQKGFTCDHCNYKCIVKSNLRQHILAKHLPRDFKANNCPKCGKNYSCSQTVRAHSKFCRQPKKLLRSLMLSCEHCKFKTPHKSNLRNHMIVKHSPLDRNLSKCIKCGKNFSRLLYLKRHLKICGLTKPKQFLCDYCGCAMNAKSDLANHIQSKHLPKDHKFHKCNKCEKVLLSKKGLKRHLKFCGISVKHLSKLKRFSCDHCEYRSHAKGYIARHIEHKHSHRSKLTCSKCGRKFFHLNVHLKTCGRTQREMYMSKRYVCDYCQYRAQSKSILKRHMQTKHLPPDPNVNN